MSTSVFSIPRKWKVDKKHYHCMLQYNGNVEENHCVIKFESLFFFIEHDVYLLE